MDLGGREEGAQGRHVQYSFVAYRECFGGVVWIDELYTAECVRQQGVARWLISVVSDLMRDGGLGTSDTLSYK